MAEAGSSINARVLYEQQQQQQQNQAATGHAAALTSRQGHRVHHFKRVYLGPSPVSASKAVSVALTLAQAESSRKQQQLHAVEASHAVNVPGTAPHIGNELQRAETRIPVLSTEPATPLDASDSPRTRRIELPPEISPSNHVGETSVDGAGLQSATSTSFGRVDFAASTKRTRRLFRDPSFASNMSFQSAKSMPSSVLSEPMIPPSMATTAGADFGRLPHGSDAPTEPKGATVTQSTGPDLLSVDSSTNEAKAAQQNFSDFSRLEVGKSKNKGKQKETERGRSRSEGQAQASRSRSRSRSRGLLASSASMALPRYTMTASGSNAGGASHNVVTLEPGAVGTSAGGTKWVGKSFDVGSNFHEVAKLRRERLRELEQQKREDAEREQLRIAEEAKRRRQRSSIFIVLNDDQQVLSPVAPPRPTFSPGGTFIDKGWLPANPITEHDEDDVPPLLEADPKEDGRVLDARRPSDVMSALKAGANRDTAQRSREASGNLDENPTASTPGLANNVNFDLPHITTKGLSQSPANGSANGHANGSASGPIPWPTSSRTRGLPNSGTSTAMHSEEDIPLQQMNRPAPNSRGERDPTVSRKTILKRDRMLVKEDWTPAEDVPPDFDELAARRYTIHNDKWREVVVILRMRRVELWQESRVHRKKCLLKLRTSIPLYSSETHLSVYSKADNIFCLTFEPSRRRVLSGKGLVHLRRTGTNIILFNPRYASAAVDWMWEIWRELGGMIPPEINVHMPGLELHVRLPVPEEVPEHGADTASTTGALLYHSNLARQHGHAEAGQEGYKLVNRQSVIGLVVQLVEAEPQLREMLDWLVSDGLQLELAWRRDNILDWIIQDLTVEQEPRCWALLSGGMFKKAATAPVLELRVAAHEPSTVRSAKGKVMEEPPAIEGFLWRVRPVSNTLDRIYLTTYDGHVFVCRPSRAFPPDRHLPGPGTGSLDVRVPRTEAYSLSGTRRMMNASVEYDTEYVSKRTRARKAFEIFFGRTRTMKREDEMAAFRAEVLDLIRYPGETEEELDSQERLFQIWQKRRQFEQIDGADGYIDLRDLYAIRTMAEATGLATEALRAEPVSGLIENDIGGEEGLSNSEDKAMLRKLRQFEVVHTNGRSVRLEAFSATLARQWIDHLTELRDYWRRKERLDAVLLMQVEGSIDPVQFGEKARRAMANKQFRNPMSETERISPLLASLWNWCIVEGCRGITRSGQLFHKLSSYAPYERGYFILIGGRLLGYALSTSERTARSRQNAGIFWRRRSENGGMRTIPLRDAYVFSGPLTDEVRGASNHGSFEGGAKTPAGSLGSGTGAASTAGLGERHKLPRVYADGMISTDEDDDCTFVIRYRKQTQDRPSMAPGALRPLAKLADRSTAAAAALFAEDDKNPIAERIKRRAKALDEKANGGAGGAAFDPAQLPRMRDRKGVTHLLFRARSKLEKELWVWAIRLEMERLVRDDKEREDALRELGELEKDGESKYNRL